METPRETMTITPDDVETIDVAELGLDESTPEDSVLVTDGAETPEAETPSEGVDDAPVEEVTEDDREAADSAPDPAPADVGRRARHDSNMTWRQRRQNRQRGR